MPDPLAREPSTPGRIVVGILIFAVCVGFAVVAVMAFRDLRVAIALHVRDAYMKKSGAVAGRGGSRDRRYIRGTPADTALLVGRSSTEGRSAVTVDFEDSVSSGDISIPSA